VGNSLTGTPRGTGGGVLRRSYVRRRGVSSVDPQPMGSQPDHEQEEVRKIGDTPTAGGPNRTERSGTHGQEQRGVREEEATKTEARTRTTPARSFGGASA